ncbi:cytochrome-c peroxidase [Geobacter sp. DSM 9736]|uniref:cytochrome-c peroxidase n=1 Tax=Geobacter sp. DSM 9736 TaxID=1277350 RepID=UPI000B509667|nr:cytochrome-c peroxidase [Geobacter sp. DSM 9736]SNB46072.1 cytochrome c peroxidase [Geobacter sp. DSM 9736]
MKRLMTLAMAVLLSGGIAEGQETLQQKAQKLFKPIPQKPAIKKGDAEETKLRLGKMLFFEPRLSASFLISCNTCHNMGLGGADLQETSVGHGWQKGPRNAPTVFNAVFNTTQFWDGRAKDLAEQAKGPIQASVEMNNKPEQVVATLKSIPDYAALFQQAFPKEQDPVTFDNMAAAIETFEATLLTPDSRFDKFLRGKKDALDSMEQKGLALFMEKGCAGCHNGINLGGNAYFPFGVIEKPGADILPPGDPGRFKVTNTEKDRYVFKSPPLRNVALTPPYFHSGKVWKLQDAVTLMGSAQLGVKLQPGEADAIAYFLKTLTGLQPKVEYPILPANSPTTPLPQIQ